jgi:diadenosine tetraphosphate (Ap4A) HIT family hydrolase
MTKKCDACEFLKSPNLKTRILLTDHWDIGLGNNQAYFGRAYMTLRSHKGSLASLNRAEWKDFEQTVRRLERAYKNVYGAEPLNWGCYMNHAFRANPFNPHVHWHIYPRYEKAPALNGVAYEDPLFGNFYDNTAVRIVDDETVEKIAAKLATFLVSN